MEAITTTAIIDAQDYRPEADQAQRTVEFDAESFDLTLKAIGTPEGAVFKIRVKGVRPGRPLAYTELVGPNAFRICLTCPTGLGAETQQAILNAELQQQLGMIAGREGLVFTTDRAILVANA